MNYVRIFSLKLSNHVKVILIKRDFMPLIRQVAMGFQPYF